MSRFTGFVVVDSFSNYIQQMKHIMKRELSYCYFIQSMFIKIKHNLPDDIIDEFSFKWFRTSAITTANWWISHIGFLHHAYCYDLTMEELFYKVLVRCYPFYCDTPLIATERVRERVRESHNSNTRKGEEWK